MKTILKKSKFLFLVLFAISLLAACSLINPNQKIVGTYEIRLENPSKKKSGGGLGNLIGNTIAKNILKGEADFRADGTADFNIDLFGVNLGDVTGDNMSFEVQNPNTLVLKNDDGDQTSFKMTKTDNGFKLQNEDATFYLKEKTE